MIARFAGVHLCKPGQAPCARGRQLTARLIDMSKHVKVTVNPNIRVRSPKASSLTVFLAYDLFFK
jgi:hypothetical protein